jgi:putative ubiquitin-RnfH superfamily antitoxin RatB of RatAB toxin-antitoxin module
VIDRINVEVVFALPDKQELVTIELPSTATVADAIEESGLQHRNLQAGIWGRPVGRGQRLSNGDRVELYRPLQRDPRVARRELAESGLTMREPTDD